MSASLLPPNATTLELALEAATTRIDAIKTDLRALWSPDDCPEGLLPWLAWSLSLDSWSADWPVEVKRNRVRRAIEIARRKGTSESVRSVVASFGGAVGLREWWQDGGSGVPHTFDLALTLSSMNGKPATAEFIESVIAEVNRTKPVRSHFQFTQGFLADGGIEVAAYARPATYTRLSLTVTA
ncbi:MAG: phage tail protein I [Rhizomicrobium sp.]